MACLLAAGAGSAHAQAPEPSGKAIKVTPQAEAAKAALVRILVPDQPVYMGDRVNTGPAGEAQLLFSDETRVVVGPSSTLLVEKYLLQSTSVASNFSINALRGSMRFITGDSPKSAYAIKTPTATIGVRGTQLDVAIGRNGETHVVVYTGAADVCGGGNCIVLNDGCSMARVPSGQAPQRIVNAPDRNTRLRDLFPYAKEETPTLRWDFKADLRACGVVTPTPIPGPSPIEKAVPINFVAPPPPPPAPAPPPPPVVSPPKEHHHHHHHHHWDRDDRHRHGFDRHPGGGVNWSREPARDGRRDSDDRGRDGRDRAGRDRDGRGGTFDTAHHGSSRHAGGGIDWSSAPGRDGRGRGPDGRDRSEASRGHGSHAGGGFETASARGGPDGRNGRDDGGRSGRDRNDGQSAGVGGRSSHHDEGGRNGDSGPVAGSGGHSPGGRSGDSGPGGPAAGGHGSGASAGSPGSGGPGSAGGSGAAGSGASSGGRDGSPGSAGGGREGGNRDGGSRDGGGKGGGGRDGGRDGGHDGGRGSGWGGEAHRGGSER